MLKIYTSFVSPVGLEMFKKSNVLPVFILRHIRGSELIGMYEGSSIHLKELSPSDELFRDKRDGKISQEEFNRKYLIEISTEVDADSILRKLEILAKVAGTDKVVLLGYGSDEKKCHRSVLSKYLSEVLGLDIKEVIY